MHSGHESNSRLRCVPMTEVLRALRPRGAQAREAPFIPELAKHFRFLLSEL